MPTSKSIPLSFKITLAVMGLLFVAAGAGFYLGEGIYLIRNQFRVNQEPMREITIAFEVSDGMPAEIYSGETLLGTTPLSIDYDEFLTYSRTEFVMSSMPARLHSYWVSKDAEWNWQLDLGLAKADPEMGAPTVLHIHQKQGNGTFMAGVPLTAMRNGMELEPIGGGGHSSSSFGREIIVKKIHYLGR